MTALVGCGGYAWTINPIGKQTFEVTCSDTQKNCYRASVKACPDGFEVLESRRRLMLIRCQAKQTSAAR